MLLLIGIVDFPLSLLDQSSQGGGVRYTRPPSDGLAPYQAGQSGLIAEADVVGGAVLKVPML